MQALEPHRFSVAESLFADLAADHLSIAAVLSGNAEGRVLVDDPAMPAIGLLWGPEGTYLAGAPRPETACDAISEAIEDWAYLHVAPGWQGDLGRVLPHRFMLAHPRIVFTIPTAPVADIVVPDGFEPVREDGFGHRILHRGEEVGRCLPDMVAGDRTEIGLWTHPDFRRRGLARLASRLTLAAAREHGVAVAGWHCLASNRGSVALARQLGAKAGRATVAHSASLPAENPGDLDPAALRGMAAHFERGAAQIGWLDFHAAAAWADAGEPERALAAVERLVSGGWQGEPEWLTGHWALAGLKDHPRFVASVARLGAVE